MGDVLQCGRFLGLTFICAQDLDEDQDLKKGTFSKNDLTERNYGYNKVMLDLFFVTAMWYFSI